MTINKKKYQLLYKSDKLFYSFWELISLGLWQSEKGKKAKKLTEDIQSINKKLDDENISEKDRNTLEKDLESKKNEFYI